MELKSKHSVLPEAKSISKSRMGLHALLPFPHAGASITSPLLLTIPRKKPGVLDDVRSSTWLDSMKASSPSHRTVSYEINNDDSDSAYIGWQTKYPSALSSFENIANIARGKTIALFLDYDGTLSPIVDNPDQAFMSDAMRSAVKNVAGYFPTAIISGRSRDKVYEFVGLGELYYAGSHGMDIMGPEVTGGKQSNLFQPAGEFLPLMNGVYESLVDKTKGIKGAHVENNKFCVSVHYRNVDDSDWEAVGDCVESVIGKMPRLRLTHGRKVLEIRPVINWDKGKAVSFLLETLGLNQCDDVLPIYVGDDRTDEDAFKVLRDRNCGYGVIVSSSPKETFAYYSLKDPSEVMEFLNSLVAWQCSASVRP